MKRPPHLRFTVLTTHYMKLEGNIDLKRAIAKNLLYLLIGLLLMIGSTLLSTLFPVFQRGVSSVEAITQKLLGTYFCSVGFQYFIPIVVMITLKPIRDALRQMGYTL